VFRGNLLPVSSTQKSVTQYHNPNFTAVKTQTSYKTQSLPCHTRDTQHKVKRRSLFIVTTQQICHRNSRQGAQHTVKLSLLVAHYKYSQSQPRFQIEVPRTALNYSYFAASYCIKHRWIHSIYTENSCEVRDRLIVTKNRTCKWHTYA
jgi:hypothetical protein